MHAYVADRLGSAWALAAGLAVASAAVTAYWVLGGTALLDTVGGYAEELARSRSGTALAVGGLVVLVKLVGALVAWGLRPRAVVGASGRGRGRGRGRGGGRWSRRLLLAAGSFGSLVLTVYGGLLVVVGALVLTGVLTPDSAVDRRALTWHVLLWDLWFLLWGLALGLATWQSARRPLAEATSA